MSAGKKGAFARTLKAVAWGFFGVRKNSEFEQDGAGLAPLAIVAVGFAAAVALVVGLAVLVRWVAAP